MSQRDEHWGDDEDVVRRLRDGKPRFSAFELDRIKTSVMSRVRPSGSRRTGSRFSLLVALLTVGAMAAGTAGTIAAGNVSQSGGTGAAQSQYRPPKCNPRHEECTCPGGSIRKSRDRCVCPTGTDFAAGTNDCRIPCPDNGERLESGRCVCPDNGHEEHGVCVHKHPLPTGAPAEAPATADSSGGSTASAPASTPQASAPATSEGSTTTVGSTRARTTLNRTRHARRSSHSRRSSNHSSRKIG